jgi:fermentation-respiration switch protein FrsA (DUF1100 family)
MKAIAGGLCVGLALGAASVARPEGDAAIRDKKVPLALRDRPQTLHLYGTRGGPCAIVASGDGGWVHLGPDVAGFLAGAGYFVVGFDSKAYLSSFTSGAKTLAATDVPGDFAALVDYAAVGCAAPTLLVGVSEGAALAVLAATDEAVKSRLLGVLALGLPEKGELGWRFRDSIIYITKGVPDEPLFAVADFVGRLAPLPIAAVQSTQDEFVSREEAERVLRRAGDPSRLWLIEAENHRFSGAEVELHAKLQEAVGWMKDRRR